MPTARDLLQRFRPVGAPGAAAPAGVPADRVAELGRELQPVFDALADAQEEAARIREAGAAQARALHDRAVEQAAALLQAARQDAVATRAETTGALVARGAAEARSVLAAADAEVAAVGRRVPARYGRLVEQVVRAIRDSAGDRTPSPAP
jgi:hypothetical protein